MSNNLMDLFKEEAEGYIRGINDGLLKVELAQQEDRKTIIHEMLRMAHSMKGAARAVGLGVVETISHYMEAIFSTLEQNIELDISPGSADTLYDGLDLVQDFLAGETRDDQIIAAVLSSLETIVAELQTTTSNGASSRNKQDSKEIQSIKVDSVEIPVLNLPELETNASPELLSLFLVEVNEYLSRLNDLLLQVEMAQNSQKPDVLREMNRIAHSMKGAARAVGFGIIEKISHYMEDVFQTVLDSRLQLTPQVADVIYDGLDLIQGALSGERASDDVIANVLVQMDGMVNGGERFPKDRPLKGSDPVPPADETPTIEIPPALMTTTLELGMSAPTAIMRAPEDTVRVTVSKLDQLMADASELLVAKLQGEMRYVRLLELRREHAKWQREWRNTRTAYIRLARWMQEKRESLSPEMGALFKFLETNEAYLMKANRELAQLGQLLVQDNMHLSTMVDQIQANVSQLRMMPFETVIGGFQRIVRDTARDLGKQVHLDIAGTAVEIDKTVLEALKDPLMHLLRNAVDHGLETPDQRKRTGKSPVGYLRLDVEQRGSEIVIRVRDDGRGIDVEKVRLKAVERGILSTQEAQTIDEENAHMLVFHSGFSTSDSVTAISGRGIGMDVVRNRVEGLRGRVSIQSAAGEGTTVTINVPVSLTRLRVITLRIGEEDFAIPSVMITRMATLSRELVFTAEGQDMIVLNNRPMPLLSLANVLSLPSDERGDMIHVVMLSTADRSVAFEVDYLFSEMELVLKPLGRELANAPYIAGGALLGSGEIIVVLDANDLVRRASGGGLRPAIVSHTPVNNKPIEQRRIRVLVVDDSITTRTLEKNILEAVGFEVYVATDGAEAWQRIPEVEPDVVVSDVEMPTMNGLELTRLIKSNEHTRDLPVILLTSLAKPEQREAGLRAGANAYLVKSRFDQQELLETVQSVL